MTRIATFDNENYLLMIAKQENIDVIVSKWSIVYQQSGVEFIDVTDSMVLLYKPDKETLSIIEKI